MYNTAITGKLSAPDENILETIKLRFTERIACLNGNMQYRESVKAKGILSKQRYRDQTTLIYLGKEIRQNNLDELRTMKGKFNTLRVLY